MVRGIKRLQAKENHNTGHEIGSLAGLALPLGKMGQSLQGADNRSQEKAACCLLFKSFYFSGVSCPLFQNTVLVLAFMHLK